MKLSQTSERLPKLLCKGLTTESDNDQEGLKTMNAIKKLLENKYVAWWKKPVIRVFTEPFYTLMDFAVFYQIVRKTLLFRAGMQALIV